MNLIPKLPTLRGAEIRHVSGWPGYAVSDTGIVWGCRSKGNGAGGFRAWRIMRQSPGSGGHLRVNMCDGKNRTPRWVHHLVLEAFDGPRPAGMVGRHFPDRNPRNNRRGNLSWSTPKQNQQDRWIHGTMREGEHNYRSALKNDDVLTIRSWPKGYGYIRDLASRFSVSRHCILHIVHNESWKHLLKGSEA
jgi:hypothetical protein